jgi:hypothetical protein
MELEVLRKHGAGIRRVLPGGRNTGDAASRSKSPAILRRMSRINRPSWVRAQIDGGRHFSRCP